MTVYKQPNPDNYFEISFSKNGLTYSTYFDSLEKSNEVKRMLTKFCVMDTFDTTYTLMNKLGEGNFGLVRRLTFSFKY